MAEKSTAINNVGRHVLNERGEQVTPPKYSAPTSPFEKKTK